MAQASDAEAYLAHLDSIFHVEPEFHILKSTMPGVSGVTVIYYSDLPEPGLITAFTYGLSLGSHPDWRASRPELMISMESRDKAWGLAVADIAEAHRFEWPFCYGTTVNFHQPISEGSGLSAFLIFAPLFLKKEQYLYITLPSSTVSIAGIYPLHVDEIALHRKIGLERFWHLPKWDPLDPHRPDLSADPANWEGAAPDA